MNIDLYITFLHNYLNNNNINFDTNFIINDINETIPNSVIYLTFGKNFNQKLNYFITDNLIELLLPNNYTENYLNLNKNILIGYIDNEHNILYVKYNIKLNYGEKKEFDNCILNIELKGKLIMKELVEKVFHPNRLFKICNSYKIEFIELIDIYS